LKRRKGTGGPRSLRTDGGKRVHRRKNRLKERRLLRLQRKKIDRENPLAQVGKKKGGKRKSRRFAGVFSWQTQIARNKKKTCEKEKKRTILVFVVCQGRKRGGFRRAGGEEKKGRNM